MNRKGSSHDRRSLSNESDKPENDKPRVQRESFRTRRPTMIRLTSNERVVQPREVVKGRIRRNSSVQDLPDAAHNKLKLRPVDRQILEDNKLIKSGYFDEFQREATPIMNTKKSKAMARFVWDALKDEFKNFMFIMQTSKGRDKICGLALYIVDMYIKCRKYAY